jgi:tellurite resistance protein
MPWERPGLFATTPPVIFAPILGLAGLGLALREASVQLGWGQGLVDLALGLITGLWLFAVVAIKVKVWRRFGVLLQDLRPLPGRAGLAAGAMSGMAMGAVLAPLAPGLALVLILGSVLAHFCLAGLTLWVMRAQGPEGRIVNPTWMMSFVGPVVAVAPLARLGQTGLAEAILWTVLPIALVIWALSARQLWREVPPVALRPLLAIHVAPASLLSLGFEALGHPGAQLVFLALAMGLALMLIAAGRWVLAGGVSAIWGSLTFPMAALAQALLLAWPEAGIVASALALGVIPWIAWRVLKLWPGGRLAQLTGAAEA